MIGSLQSGLTGLRANQTSLEVIGNNIANVNTTGFKAGRANFADVLARTIRPGTTQTAPIQVGRGVQVSSISTVMRQGGLQESALVSDMAIQGNGFFIVSDGERDFFTRSGNFTLNAQGQLVSPDGFSVQGFNAIAGQIPVTAAPTAIQMPTEPIPPTATSQIGLAGNLDSGSKTIAVDTNGNQVLVGGQDRFVGTEFSGTAILQDDGTTISVIGAGTDFTQLTAGDIFIVGDRQFTIDSITDATNLTLTRPTLTGTIQGTAASRTINGTGTLFTRELRVGDTLSIDGNDVTVSSIVNDTTLVLSTALANDVALGSALSYGTAAGLATQAGGRMETGVTPAGSTMLSNLGTNFPVALRETANLLVTDAGSGRSVVVSLLGSETLDDLAAKVASAGMPSYTLNDQNFTLKKLDPGNGTSTSVQLVDSQGNSHTAVMSMFKTDVENTWAWTMRIPDAEAIEQAPSLNYGLNTRGLLTFNPDGTLAGFTNAIGTDRFTLQFSAKLGTENFAIDMNRDVVAGVTQYDLGASEVVVTGNNGIKPGTFQSFTVDQSGMIIGTFSNGDTTVVGQVLIARFQNAEGLERVGSNIFANTQSSGEAVVGTAGLGGNGSILSNTLELSNVDLAEQFTQMILAQRGFQSSANVITTTDTILQELMGLKRG
ncbi:MAG: flagellar hook-basal body complex protein [Candidatus Poribacteria bacterium]|nr:flagellar hook-basal body complex protein [Candidatus Poribacteria bacterium]